MSNTLACIPSHEQSILVLTDREKQLQLSLSKVLYLQRKLCQNKGK